MSRGMFFQWGAMRRVRTVCAGEMPRQRFFLNLERLSVGGEITNALKMPRLRAFGTVFFNVFGITRRRVASFEAPVKKGDGQGGFTDLLWKGVLLVEHKSRGKNLDRAAGAGGKSRKE